MRNKQSSTYLTKIQVFIQYLVPQKCISRLAEYLMDCQNPLISQRIIRWFIKRYRVDMSEAKQSDPSAYSSFNAFFTRELRINARIFPQQTDQQTVISPADGCLSQFGITRDGTLIQAKGQTYTVSGLLGGDDTLTQTFNHSTYACVYLSPKDYHRVHMPYSGVLMQMIQIPGRLFSVSPLTADHVPNLFARNERVAAIFDTDHGKMAVVFIGAMIVGSIVTRWAGKLCPPHFKHIGSTNYEEANHRFERGAEIGHFQLGSTVVVLWQGDQLQLSSTLEKQQAIRLGNPLGQY